MEPDDHYEYLGADPASLKPDALRLMGETSDPDECRRLWELEPDAMIWRRRVTYGPWEAIVGDDPRPMRRFAGIVAAEGKPTIDKRVIGQGALTLPTDPVPLMKLPDDELAARRGAELVGKITGFRRHGLFIAVDGLTTLEKGEYGVGVDLSDVTTHTDEEGVLHITAARIMGATISANPAWPYLAIIDVE